MTITKKEYVDMQWNLLLTTSPVLYKAMCDYKTSVSDYKIVKGNKETVDEFLKLNNITVLEIETQEWK